MVIKYKMNWNGSYWGLTRHVGPYEDTREDKRRANSRAGGPHAGNGNWMQTFNPSRDGDQDYQPERPYMYVGGKPKIYQQFNVNKPFPVPPGILGGGKSRGRFIPIREAPVQMEERGIQVNMNTSSALPPKEAWYSGTQTVIDGSMVELHKAAVKTREGGVQAEPSTAETGEQIGVGTGESGTQVEEEKKDEKMPQDSGTQTIEETVPVHTQPREFKPHPIHDGPVVSNVYSPVKEDLYLKYTSNSPVPVSVKGTQIVERFGPNMELDILSRSSQEGRSMSIDSSEGITHEIDFPPEDGVTVKSERKRKGSFASSSSSKRLMIPKVKARAQVLPLSYIPPPVVGQAAPFTIPPELLEGFRRELQRSEVANRLRIAHQAAARPRIQVTGMVGRSGSARVAPPRSGLRIETTGIAPSRQSSLRATGMRRREDYSLPSKSTDILPGNIDLTTNVGKRILKGSTEKLSR